MECIGEDQPTGPGIRHKALFYTHMHAHMVVIGVVSGWCDLIVTSFDFCALERDTVMGNAVIPR